MKTGTPFGFVYGRENSWATTFGEINAIAANVNFVINAKNPASVYQTFFHEERHIWQNKTRNLTSQVQRMFSRLLYNKDGSKSIAQWNANPRKFKQISFLIKK